MTTQAQSFTPEQVRRGRMTLLALAALFFVPLFIAFALYYGGGWRPAETTNHGLLYQPAVPLGARWAGENWRMVYIGDGRCDAACRDALVVMRQSRLALANEMSRVQRVFVATGECCDRSYLKGQHEGLETIDGTDPALRADLAAFAAPDQAHALYIVDPLGNLVLRFDARENAKGLLTDVKKLLKLSHIG